jgi:serine/threonine protein kinase
VEDRLRDRIGTIVGGAYRLEKPIASSEQLVTYRARHLEMERRVAVQLLRIDERQSEDWIRAFRREVRVLSKLRHPRVAEIHDFGQMHDGAPYLVVEYLDGRPLSWILREEGPQPVERVVSVVADVARGLRYVHQFGVYHLAITPPNVVLVENPRGEHLKIVDFLSGRWHRIDPRVPSVPDWRVAAPELLRGDDPSPATDIYCLGHFAWACLAGELPLHEADERSSRAVHLSPKRWTLPEELEIPGQLAAIIERCLAKEVDERFESCGELIDALEQFENSAADTVRLPSVGATTQRGFFPGPGEVFAEKFEVESSIGRGGFARVFRARSLERGRPVALKILRPDRTADATVARRFVREGKLIFTLLSNPHTISVFDYGESADGLLYIAFEFIDGETLDELSTRQKKLSPMRVARILEQCLASLTEAHGMGVLHRDIKPSNIMLSRRDGIADWVTVLDFGVAKITSDVIDTTDLTSTGAALGTPRYMSPEQISGEPLGPESDLYSLGLVAYELLVGEQAVGGANTLEIISNQLDPQSVIIPSSAGVPAPLALVVNRMMRKDRNTRHSSAHDVLIELRDLDREVGDETVDTGTR